MESSYGTTLFVCSNGSLDSFPENTASCFTNTLKSSISLNHNIKYEVQLANLHIPAYENILIKGDYENSYLSYNIGQFIYDPPSRRYKLNDDTSKELFRLAPNRDFEGLFGSGETSDQFYQFNPNDNSQGNPSLNIQKENMLQELGKSLELNKTSKSIKKENKIVSYLKKRIHRADHFRKKFDSSNLLATWYSEINGLLFADLNHIPQEEMYDMMSFFLQKVNYSPNNLSYLLKSTSQYSDAIPVLVPDGRSVIDDLESSRFVKHIRLLANKCDLMALYGSFSDGTIKSFIRSGILKKGEGLIKACEGSETLNSSSDDVRRNKKLENIDFSENLTSDNEDQSNLIPNAPLLGIFVRFGRKMSKFLGVDENQMILIGHYGFPTTETPQNYFIKISPDFRKPKVETVMIYTDIVSPSTRVGGVQTNILDIISAPNTGTIQRSMAQGQYRPLRNHEISEITIEIYNRDGDVIHYPKDSFSAVELKIRPVPEIQ